MFLQDSDLQETYISVKQLFLTTFLPILNFCIDVEYDSINVATCLDLLASNLTTFFKYHLLGIKSLPGNENKLLKRHRGRNFQSPKFIFVGIGKLYHVVTHYIIKNMAAIVPTFT